MPAWRWGEGRHETLGTLCRLRPRRHPARRGRRRVERPRRRARRPPTRSAPGPLAATSALLRRAPIPARSSRCADLLALPATEARYYTAAVDDAGRPLEGRCTYAINGGGLPGRWWSLTLYDRAGYLVANQPGIYSVGSAGLPSSEQAHWTVVASPDKQPGHWLPTGGIDRFELTLRAYLPDDGGKGNFTQAQLPSIVREACK